MGLSRSELDDVQVLFQPRSFYDSLWIWFPDLLRGSMHTAEQHGAVWKSKDHKTFSLLHF